MILPKSNRAQRINAGLKQGHGDVFFIIHPRTKMAQSFKEEYKRQYLLGKKERQELLGKREKFCLLQDQVARAEAFGEAEDMKAVNAALGHLRQNDLISLKSLYKKLFPKILVRFQDNSKIQLKFFFNNV